MSGEPMSPMGDTPAAFECEPWCAYRDCHTDPGRHIEDRTCFGVERRVDVTRTGWYDVYAAHNPHMDPRALVHLTHNDGAAVELTPHEARALAEALAHAADETETGCGS